LVVNAMDSLNTPWRATAGDGAADGVGDGEADGDGVGSACATPLKKSVTRRAAAAVVKIRIEIFIASRRRAPD
jgi:hypothetical protein